MTPNLYLAGLSECSVETGKELNRKQKLILSMGVRED